MQRRIIQTILIVVGLVLVGFAVYFGFSLFTTHGLYSNYGPRYFVPVGIVSGAFAIAGGLCFLGCA